MVDENALAVSLEEFGLGRYEAQAYVALVTNGTISASELAYYSNIPRPKAYSTIKKLAAKNLIVVSQSKPIMCTAIAPENAFDKIVHEQINKVNAMNTLVSNLKKASEKSRKTRGSEEKRYFHISANNVIEQLQTMIEGTKESIKIIADQFGLGVLAECKESTRIVVQRDLDLKIIIPSSLIGSEIFKKIPNGVDVRSSDIVQNCFIFDDTEILLINSHDGKGAVFPSTDIFGSTQSRMFANIWKSATKTAALVDMTKNDAQEIYKIIKIVTESGLPFMLNSIKSETSMVDLLALNGISLKSKTLDDIFEIVDVLLQITCSGHIHCESKTSITAESRLNSRHSMPWINILNGYLHQHGYETKTIYQDSTRGEKIHIKISHT